MVDLGEARNVLGFELSRNREEKKLWITQEKYLNEILGKFNMGSCNPAKTPSSPGDRLKKSPHEQIEESMRNVPYQEAVGSLLFASQVSRPDIAHAVSSVSRFNSNPAPEHWTAVKRILRYIKGTTSMRLEYDGKKPSPILGFCDADWANDLEDRRSTTGYVFLKSGPISWATKRQPTVALSTTEAEYMSASAATQEALWLRGLCEEIQPSDAEGPTMIFIDNQGALNLALNGAYQARTKHIDIRHHFLREKVRSGQLTFRYVSSKDMVADSLTKPLDCEKFQKCISMQGLRKMTK
uniref:Retrovirus-related Pol polyprotein from transposon TNT 1-94 n=1 Tax=Lygus hesperus TaxID=30085 RepID=A0A0K8SE75_LYGHE